VNGYSSSVTLSCGSGGPVTCTPAPGSVTPTASGAAFTVSVSSDVVQNYGFNIVATGTDSGHTTHSASVVFNSTFDFAINNNSAAETVTAGQTASYNLEVRPLGNASTFPMSVTLARSGLPALSTCSFTPGSAGSGRGGGGGGGAGQPGTPTGNYTITATATSGSLTHTAQVSLTVH